MKKYGILFVVMLLFLLSSFIGCDGCYENKNNNNVVEIGAILPLTGGGAEWGIASKNALLMALDDYNKTANKYKVKLIIEDSKTTSKDALSALNKLKSSGIKLIIGDIISSNVLAMAPIVEESEIILISPGASNPEISYAGDFVFRTWQSDAFEANVCANYIVDTLKWRKIAVLYLENGYGTGIANEFSKILKSKGITSALIESFKVNQQNFRDILLKIQNIKPDGIFLASYPEENVAILKQMQELRMNYTVVGTQGFVSEGMSQLLKVITFPIIFSIPTPPDSTAKNVRRFVDGYAIKYGVKPAITADASYDAFNLLVKMVEAYGLNTSEIKKGLYNVRNYEGASGIISFNKYGDVEKPFTFVKNND